MNVTLAFDFGPAFVDRLRSSYPSVTITPAYTAAEQLALAPEAELQLGQISRDVFLAARKLKWFHFIGIGFDSILRKVPEFADSGVVMTNARGTHVIPMAEYTIGMMIALGHHLSRSMREQAEHRWEVDGYKGSILELADSTLGILAFGDIGRAVAKRARAFGMRIFAVDLDPGPMPDGVEAVWGMERLDEMLALSDWLVVAAPRTAESTNLIGATELRWMPAGAHVVVVSRGAIVNETDLVAAIDEGHIGGAALDATTQEPPDADSPLWDHEKVILTPHVSAESTQLLERRADIMHENLGRYIAGQPLRNVCDLEKGY